MARARPAANRVVARRSNMDPVRNPCAPGAGSQPPELAGRAEIIDSADICAAAGSHRTSSAVADAPGIAWRWKELTPGEREDVIAMAPLGNPYRLRAIRAMC